MKLSVKALALSFGVICAAVIFLVGMAHLIWPGYGTAVLEVAASIYPGYAVEPSFLQMVLGTVYGVVDGAIGGGLIAWLYNRFTSARPSPPAAEFPA